MFCPGSVLSPRNSRVDVAGGIANSTLQRIRDRLKSLYRATWQPADDKLFDLMTREGRQLDDIVDDGGAESDQDTSTVEP